MIRKNKAWSFHGPGGILSGCQRVDVVNAMAMPTTGLVMNLPWVATTEANPMVAILTGQTEGSGSLPNELCGDWPIAGQLKVCRQVWPLSRQGIDSQVIALDQLGLMNNRCDILDQELVGNPFQGATQESPLPFDFAQALRDEKTKALTEMWVEYVRRYASLAYEGDPANNLGQGYQESYGLETIINTGYQDALVAGTPCPASDPTVIAFDDNIDTDPAGIVSLMVDTYLHVQQLARQTGIARVQWAWVMRESQFARLAAVWPCVYNTSGCTPVGSSQIVIDGNASRRQSDEIYQNEALPIMGDSIPVIIDDGLPTTIEDQAETNDIYLIPVSSPSFVRTNGAISYWEYFNFNNAFGALRGDMAELANVNFQVVGGGRFLVWRKATINNCIQFTMLGRHRLMVRAPFLAARITGVSASFTIPRRSPFPGDTYFVNGGLYYQDAPTFEPPIGA